jgi:hypothetical protein
MDLRLWNIIFGDFYGVLNYVYDSTRNQILWIDFYDIYCEIINIVSNSAKIPKNYVP